MSLQRASDGKQVDLGAALESSAQKTLLVLGTHPADFNTVEYCQKVRTFWPQLVQKGISRCLLVVNGEASSCMKLAELLDLPAEVELFADPVGEAGRRFGVSRGWKPDDNFSPYLKLFVMGIGLGDLGTLPAVLAGYVGDPNGRRTWVENSLKQGQLAGRWPDFMLEIAQDGSIVANKFDDAPLVGGWGRRPFELAVLRLQNLIGVQFSNWDQLKPVDDRCLTQLGGCTVVGPGGEPIYSWVDAGLCDVPDMDEMLEAL
eukprot:CAMPEP_0172723570 /NCGR_PEP_ID=MMETSP1074-20121228/84032_1 /TAXON_ID=2916 /ORGANISM="Ceratium fusus, Strain PA161109" /LENGTH=258 /DNA_ID=CAMNT_0013549841 /DNA_START=194 /DNA_END=970 /DNA_ORIENTATION=-